MTGRKGYLNFRVYYPDFVVKTINGELWIIETKGIVDVDVEHKDKRIKLWCEDAAKLTDDKWSFVRVNQEDFGKYKFRTIKELLSTSL